MFPMRRASRSFPVVHQREDRKGPRCGSLETLRAPLRFSKMCGDAIAAMSDFGTKQTLESALHMSAFGGKSDMLFAGLMRA